jgi:acyl carrier protein
MEGAFDDVVARMVPPPVDAAEPADADPLVAELVEITRGFSKERTVAPDDNLFEVGLSSLTLTEIVLAIDERYPGKLDISDLFDVPTLREIATFLRRKE